MAEKGLAVQERAKTLGLNKRTFARYMNLCYLAPAIVADILEYKNPKHFTLRQLMDLAEGDSDFKQQEKEWEKAPQNGFLFYLNTENFHKLNLYFSESYL